MKTIIKPPEEFLEDVAFLTTYDGPGMPDIWCHQVNGIAWTGLRHQDQTRNTFAYYDKNGDKVMCEEVLEGENASSNVMKYLHLRLPPLPPPAVKLVPA